MRKGKQQLNTEPSPSPPSTQTEPYQRYFVERNTGKMKKRMKKKKKHIEDKWQRTLRKFIADSSKAECKGEIHPCEYGKIAIVKSQESF